MRIAIAGIGTESASFSPNHTVEQYFLQERGAELLEQYEWPERLGAAVDGVEWVPIFRAMAAAAGPVVPEVYDAFEREILDGLREAGPLDGVYLDLHGAMKIDGRDRAEEDFVRRIREIVGPDTILSASMDPHGNLSEELATHLDLAAVHRHAPHIDTWETRERAVLTLIETIERGERPLKAWVRVPVLLPGERTSTVYEPAATVFGALEPAIHRYSAVDVGLWVGFFWADEARCTASVLVTGYDEQSILACAKEVATSYWDARRDFGIVSEHHGTYEEAIDFLLEADPPKPLYISDSGDNITAGASGDMTYALERTVSRRDLAASGKVVLIAGLWDPSAVDAAEAAGLGATFEHALGAILDDRFASPVPGTWRVERFIEGTFDAGVVGVLLSQGAVHVSAQRYRSPFLRPTDPAFVKRPMQGQAFIEPGDYDAVVVKNGYLFPGQRDDAASAFMAITPGPTDLDFTRLRYMRIDRPMFPFDDEFEAELTPKILPTTGA